MTIEFKLTPKQLGVIALGTVFLASSLLNVYLVLFYMNQKRALKTADSTYRALVSECGKLAGETQNAKDRAVIGTVSAQVLAGYLSRLDTIFNATRELTVDLATFQQAHCTFLDIDPNPSLKALFNRATEIRQEYDVLRDELKEFSDDLEAAAASVSTPKPTAL